MRMAVFYFTNLKIKLKNENTNNTSKLPTTVNTLDKFDPDKKNSCVPRSMINNNRFSNGSARTYRSSYCQAWLIFFTGCK